MLPLLSCRVNGVLYLVKDVFRSLVRVIEEESYPVVASCGVHCVDDVFVEPDWYLVVKHFDCETVCGIFSPY